MAALDSAERSSALASFVLWAQSHITGDEKGQAQLFIDRLFQAFGHAGSLDVGGEPEYRVRKAKEDGGGTSFADYVWKPVVLIEMKKRGEKLSRHYRQAFDYWARLVPGRPRYVVLCNFDEFEVYDFETQMDAPMGRASLATLADNYGALAFLQPGQPRPVFDNDHVAVTREAAAKLAACYKKFRARDVPQPLAQRFILQMLVAFFAEDIGLMAKYFVTRLLEECTDDTAFDLLGGLFTAMNSPGGTPGGRFKGVPYFNGGLFAEPARIELTGPEIVLLRDCAKSDWSKVQPEVFGTVFEQTLDADARHASGAHFTSPADIMKIVGPTIVEPWREQIESAKTAKRLGELLERIQHFRVLDPACGSGNFLYIAYRELKRLEARIYEKLEAFSSKAERGQMRLSYLSAQNFFGLDINPFAVELAKVTMMIARKLAIDELYITEPALPLDNLDHQFRCADALLATAADGTTVRTAWPAVDVIIGNPPFLDARKMTVEMGRDYVGKLEKLFPVVPRRADFCVYWFHRAADHLPACTSADTVSGRAGLVGTQNIRNNESREGGLDHVVQDSTLVEAVDNQPWSGEANVHVSIANWVKTHDPALLPGKCRLWSKVESRIGKPRRKRDTGPASKEFDLSCRDVAVINSALSDQTDVSQAAVLRCNIDPKVVFEGVQTGHDGFVVDAAEGRALLDADSKHAVYVKPFINGSDLLSGRYANEPEYVIDLSELDILAASALPQLLAIPKTRVLAEWQANAAKENAELGKDRGEHQNRIDAWWALKRPRGDLQVAIRKRPRYIACSAVMKRPTFVFLSSEFLPTNALKVFAFADDYSFGLLQSRVHWLWFVTKCSKLTERFRYTPESVFDTFPWPQAPTKKALKAVAAAGCEVRRIRAEVLPTLKGGLRELYRTLELPGANPLKDAHAALDAAVLVAYGFHPGRDLLAQLLALNQEVAARQARGEAVTAPGLPSGLSAVERDALITTDCIRPS